MRSILAKSHSLLQRGQTERVFSQRWMQSRWNTCPHVPNAMLSPFSLFGDGLACGHGSECMAVIKFRSNSI